MSATLASVLAELEEGPRGVNGALQAIRECARQRLPLLDLQQMMLTDQHIEQLGTAFQTVADHVTNLNIFMNEITVLSATIALLPNLQVLHAGCNPLLVVQPDLLQRLPKLRELDIGFSETLEQLPDVFSSNHALQIFHAGNGRLKTIPPSLFRCEDLEELHVYGNSITHISEEIGCLRSLRELNIGRNQVSSLPESISNCTSLQVLHAYENCLSVLPVGLTKLTNLTTLNVDFNVELSIPPRSVRSISGVQATAAFHANGSAN